MSKSRKPGCSFFFSSGQSPLSVNIYRIAVQVSFIVVYVGPIIGNVLLSQRRKGATPFHLIDKSVEILISFRYFSMSLFVASLMQMIRQLPRSQYCSNREFCHENRLIVYDSL